MGGIGIPAQAEAFDKFPGQFGPRDFRIRRDMGVVVTHRAVDLAEQLDLLEFSRLALQAPGEIREFLAQGGRRGRLTMRARQHRLRGKLLAHGGQCLGQLRKRRAQHFAAIAQHQRVGKIVDVPGGTGEMHEFEMRREFGLFRKFFLEKIFDGLDVVASGRLEFLDARGVGGGKAGGKTLEKIPGVVAQWRTFGDAGLGDQLQQPFDFDPHPIAHETVFAEYGRQFGAFLAIAPVKRRKRKQFVFLVLVHSGSPAVRLAREMPATVLILRLNADSVRSARLPGSVRPGRRPRTGPA